MIILRRTIDTITNIIGWIRRSRRFEPKQNSQNGNIKINLGCGLAVTKGWINIDASLNALIASWPRMTHKWLYRLSGANHYYSLKEYCDLLSEHIFVHHDLSHSLPLKEQTVDFIYSSHFLEHLFRPNAEQLLEECLRILKPGGTVRICVPDLAYAISLYSLGEKEKMLEEYFFVEGKGSYLARHKYMYDFKLLKALLEKIGFTQVTLCSYQIGNTPDINKLDNRQEDTLFVEAIKLL